ncbi:hypothetical protein N7497_000768 [Penicillium chrysogenum]|nr:hypothetical protein N7497_000768 [Penicillium chrysogenum]
MGVQTPIANGTDVLRPPSAPLSTTSSAQSTHPIASSCTKCRSKHRRCDRTRPVCQNCLSMGFEAECSYPSVALPVTENESAQNRITQKIGAPLFGPLFENPSASPLTGEKRPRVAGSSERTELVNDVVAVHIHNHSSHAQQMQTLKPPPAKRQRISELYSGSAASQSAPEPAQTSLSGTSIPSGSRSGRPPRSISPTLPGDEMELRCNLTTEINVQRMRHRNLATGTLRNIVKLLMKAKSERPTTEPTIAGSSGVPSNNEWREEDDLMQAATIKLEKGGPCSRTLLSRFENFLYGPLMSPNEKKMQERIICVEECLSSASAPPSANHNALFLHRLKSIILNPKSYSLNPKDPRIGLLRHQILAAIATDSKLTGANRRKIAELLDPDKEIANISANSPGVKTETPISTRKAPPKPTSPRVPSSHTPRKPSRTTTTRIENSVVSLSPSTPHPPLPPLLSLSTTYPPPFPSRSSSLSTPPLEPIDPTGDTTSSQSNDTAASPSMDPPSKKRPTPGGQSNDAVAPSPDRAASGTQPSNSNDLITPAPEGVSSDTQLSNSNSTIAHSQLFPSDIPKKLWGIFLKIQGLFFPALDLDQLKVAFNMAVNDGRLAPNVIDPVLGFCLAVACHLTLEESLWEGRKWSDAAASTLEGEGNTPSLHYFHRRILHVQYVHMVGHLEKGWEIISLAVGKAESLQMHTLHGGCLAVDKESLEQVRVIWLSLWMKKLSLALQLGVTNQCLDVFHVHPMPLQSHIQDTMEAYGSKRSFAAASFFIACASLLRNTDDLITVENSLRVTRMECPIKWISNVDLRPFHDLHESLSSWEDGLPKCLRWKGASIEFASQYDPIGRRLSLLAHLRYIYFRLRQYRPFLILALRFSHSCACEKNPHITGRDMDSVNSSLLLALVYHGAIKCLTAAQDIVQTLSLSYNMEKDDHSKCEQLDHLYAAGLVLIAAMRIPCLVDGTQHCASPTAAVDRSMNTMGKDLRQVETMLRLYQGRCQQAPRLKRRIDRCRDALGIIRLHSVSSPTFISDSEIRFSQNVWLRIYDRLGLDVPFTRFPNGRADNGKATGRRMTFGWLESLPFDLDSGSE